MASKRDAIAGMYKVIFANNCVLCSCWSKFVQKDGERKQDKTRRDKRWRISSSHARDNLGNEVLQAPFILSEWEID